MHSSNTPPTDHRISQTTAPFLDDTETNTVKPFSQILPAQDHFSLTKLTLHILGYLPFLQSISDYCFSRCSFTTFLLVFLCVIYRQQGYQPACLQLQQYHTTYSIMTVTGNNISRYCETYIHRRPSRPNKPYNAHAENMKE